MFPKALRASKIVALGLLLGRVLAAEAQAVPRQGEADHLKTPALHRGASLSGWVKADSGVVLDPARCRVVFTPHERVDPEDTLAVEAVARMNREAKVDARGFFQVLDLIPGEYKIHAEQDDALAEDRGTIQVAKGAAVVLSAPFLLEPPLDLEIAVKPAKDWHGRPWVVHVERSGYRPETSVGAFTSEEGIARFPRQHRGLYMVNISDAVGEGRVTARDLYFDVPTARREFPISWVEVEGTIRRDNHPLRAALWFGDSLDLASGLLKSDDEGRFSGTLMRDGTWSIQVKTQAPPLSVDLERTIEAKNGRAEIEIEIPAPVE